jgi:hypothetical protein
VAWVEKGVAPPESTAYQVVDGQVVVPATASERKVCSGGECKRTAACARVKVGEAVEFTAVAEAPAKAALMVKAEWDFEGTGEYPVPSEIKPQSRVAVTTNYAFAKPGAHFPALRVTSNRLGDARSPYAQVQNLGRVRVVVT